MNKANKESKRQKTERVVPYVENDQNCAVFIGLAKCRQTNVICIGCEVSHILHPKRCYETCHCKEYERSRDFEAPFAVIYFVDV